MYEQFSWRGEPISDIHAWAAARGERMVKYHAERTVAVLFDRIEEDEDGVIHRIPLARPELVREERDGEMPESFWVNLHMDHGWTYTEVK